VAVPALVLAFRDRRAAIRRAVVARRIAQFRRHEERRSPRRRAIGVAVAVAVLAVGLPMTAIIVAVGGTRNPTPMGGVSALAARDIPASALAAYQEAAAVWRLDWAILAGVGKIECNHGRSRVSGCNPPGTMNSAGARGFMQFLGDTWRRGLGQHEMEPRSSPPAANGRGYATDGDGDGDADPWSWPDAANSAARYLVALGVTRDPARALLGYNHSQAYVSQVLAVAASYRAAGAGAAGYEGTPGHVPLTTVDGITVHSQVAAQVAGLVEAARADGYLLGGTGYRAPARQIELRRAHCGSSQYAIYEMPSSQCSPPTARPGSSKHELGLAVDFSCDGALIRSRSSACFAWMSANAPRFGLHNLPSEPWHWSVDGT
jgi:D-alanyl-D-alanine carboxypeptidase